MVQQPCQLAPARTDSRARVNRQAEDEKKPVDVGSGFESGAFESLESDFQEVRRKLLRLRRRAQQAAWDAPCPATRCAGASRARRRQELGALP